MTATVAQQDNAIQQRKSISPNAVEVFPASSKVPAQTKTGNSGPSFTVLLLRALGAFNS